MVPHSLEADLVVQRDTITFTTDPEKHGRILSPCRPVAPEAREP
jgi:hypothetical protein